MPYRRRPRLPAGVPRLRYGSHRVARALLVLAVAAALVLADRYGCFGTAPQPDVEKYEGPSFRVQRAVDGDTLVLDVPDADGDPTRVRLLGVDTPETVHPDKPPQHYGPEASRFVKSVTEDREIRMTLDVARTRDKYERLLAYVYLPDGRMLNRVLIEEGYGYADPRFRHPLRDEFARLMRQARKEGKGLWKDVRTDHLPEYLRN